MDVAGRAPGPLQRAARRAESFLEEGQVWIALAAGAGLFLIQVPGVDDALARIGIESNQKVRTMVSVVLLTSILLEIWHLKKRLTPTKPGRVHYGDPHEAYAALTEKAKAIDSPQQRTIEVLGMTLYSAWPVLSFLLARSDMNNWTVRLATLAPDATAPDPWVPEDWISESQANIKQIKSFAETQGDAHGHRFEVIEYDFVPGVHGFRLGTGDVFVSVLLWQEDGRLGKPGFTYEYISWDDASPAASASRNLFANWFDRALACSENRAAASSDGRNPFGGLFRR